MAGIKRLQDAREIAEARAGTRVILDPLALEDRDPDEKNAANLSKH